MQTAIIGGGMMGVGIAHAFAVAGHDVCVYEPFAQVRASFLTRVAQSLKELGDDPDSIRRVTVTDDLAKAVEGRSFITEAVPEKQGLKYATFKQLVELAPADAILASNSSVMPIGLIVGDLPTAERMVGTHWWNPPVLIPLVEVIQGAQTSDDTVARTMDILASIGKKPAHIKKDVPGFVANRLQHALWREAIAMVAEGICDAKTIDDCVKNSFGLRLAVLGPLENADLVGTEVTRDIHHTIVPELDRHDGPHEYLDKLIENGKLGFKSGEGFQKWSPERMDATRKNLVQHLKAARAR